VKQTSHFVSSTIFLLCASLAPSLASCRSQPNASVPGAPVPISAQEELRGDHELERALALLEPRIREDSSGRVLEFQLENTSGEPRQLFIAVEWFDRGGRPVAAARRVWTPVELDAHGRRAVTIPVPVPEAVSWRWHATARPHDR
jgi:hypothetical protein